MPSTHSPKPLVVIIALDEPAMFNEIYKDFLRILNTKADVQQITTEQYARMAFTSLPKPKAILCADDSLTEPDRASLVQESSSYVRTGGILVFMGLFSSFAQWPAITSLFSTLGLKWRSGAYTRCEFEVNPRMKHFNTGVLPSGFSQKALHVADVSDGDAVFLEKPWEDQDSDGEYRVTKPSPTSDKQTPAAFAKVGEGRVGFVGDVNSQEETTVLLLAMCGL